MSASLAQQKRTALYLSIGGLLAMVAALSAISALDPSGVSLRIGMVLLTVGAALWLPWQALLPAAVMIWFVPNLLSDAVEDQALFDTSMMLELPAVIGLAIFASFVQRFLRQLEAENILIGAANDGTAGGIDPETGLYEERLLRPAIEAELVRSRRFGRQFALVLVGIDPLRQRFDYRDEEEWHAGFIATSALLLSTRAHIDRTYRYGESGFALVLPEAAAAEVHGLIRRLRRVAQNSSPAEGEQGGPLPAHFGATFFPQSATTVDDLIRRAEVALRLADRNSSHVQIDGAEAPDMLPPALMRRESEEDDTAAEASVATAPSSSAIAELMRRDPMTEESLVANGITNGAQVQAQAPVHIPAPPRADDLTTRIGDSDEPLDDEAVADLMKRLDETLNLIHSLRTPGSPR